MTYDWYLNLFIMLSNSRTGSHVKVNDRDKQKIITIPNPISISEIGSLYDRIEIPETFDNFIEIIQYLDKEYIGYIESKTK